MHWAPRRKYRDQLASDAADLTRHLPAGKPFEKARVTITRYSTQVPDRDNLYGGVKHLVDCLVVRCDRHPTGLGFIVDDDPDRLTLDVQHVRCSKRAEQRTVVLIENLH